MAKNNTEDEILSINLYREYNITEWREKCLLLSLEERIQVLKELRSGLDSPLVKMVLLPFPQFVVKYYSQYPAAEKYLEDPTFGYRLYLLNDPYIEFINRKIKAAKGRKDFDYDGLNELLMTPFEKIRKIRKYDTANTNYEKKYAYICQYITAEEAERMQLTSFTFYTQGQYRGFDLEGKLYSLNDAARIIISLYLGLYGRPRKTISEISELLKLSSFQVEKVINYLFDSIMMSTESFRGKIGFIPRKYKFGEYREYSRRDYRELDIHVQARYILKNLLSPEEKTLLSNFSNSEQISYVKEKYINPKMASKKSNPEFKI